MRSSGQEGGQQEKKVAGHDHQNEDVHNEQALCDNEPISLKFCKLFPTSPDDAQGGHDVLVRVVPVRMVSIVVAAIAILARAIGVGIPGCVKWEVAGWICHCCWFALDRIRWVV